MKRNLTFRSLLYILAGFFLSATASGQEKSAMRQYLESYDSIQFFRPYDQNGINMFETPKNNVAFEGVRVRIGAGFSQQFQALKHSNYTNVSTNANYLYPLGNGFNTAQANLNMDFQLADGIRLNLVTYLSARHHNEAWVKGGYIQFDRLPFKGDFWTKLMKYATIKVGHMEINYGDAHFRRSDGGSTLYNPFMENYIMDAFTTEIGGEVYLQHNGIFGMIGMSNGEIKGDVKEGVSEKKPAIYLKGGIDKQLTDKARVRVSGSYYIDKSSASNTLYWGDRTGSNYFMVLEKYAATALANAWSGRVNPGFGYYSSGLQLNGFVKVGGLELFGTIEQGKGRSAAEKTMSNRTINQLAGDVVYRIGARENVFLGARYNTVKGELYLNGVRDDVKVDRVALSGGWFVTKNVMLKGEYVVQHHKDYPSGTGATQYTDGKFDGIVIQAVVGF